MKKIIISLFVLGFLGTMNSCSDDNLDLLPEIDTPLQVGIKDVYDMQRVLNGAYGTISAKGAFGADLIVFSELMSDNAYISNTNDGYYTNLSDMNYTDTSGDVSSLYVQLYGVVRNAGFVINSGVSPSEDDKALYNEILGQAHIMRGLAYFYLTQFFAPSPDVDPNSEYGIILKNEEFNSGNSNAKRASLKESLQAVEDDLLLGVSLAPMTATDKTLFTKTVGNFILSKFYLYAKNDAKALEYANKVINESPSNYDFINDGEEYVNYFNHKDNLAYQENKSETIWEIPQTGSFNLSVNAHPGVFFASNGQHRSVMYRPSFKEKFLSSDIRVELFKGNGANTDEPRGTFSDKWQRINEEGPFTQNIKVFRMTEAKFNRWEAMAKLGQGAQALAELNEFSAMRGGQSYTGGDIIKDILDAKQLEFFSEGTRFLDLKRNSLPIIKVGNCLVNCHVQPTDKLFIFPIPFSELNANPDAVQTPVWLN